MNNNQNQNKNDKTGEIGGTIIGVIIIAASIIAYSLSSYQCWLTFMFCLCGIGLGLLAIMLGHSD